MSVNHQCKTDIKMPNVRLIIIPVSGDIKIGRLKSATRKAGLDIEEFQDLIKGDLKHQTEESGFWSKSSDSARRLLPE